MFPRAGTALVFVITRRGALVVLFQIAHVMEFYHHTIYCTWARASILAVHQVQASCCVCVCTPNAGPHAGLCSQCAVGIYGSAD